MDKLAILIPAYNEEITISKVVKDVLSVTKNIRGTSMYTTITRLIKQLSLLKKLVQL